MTCEEIVREICSHSANIGGAEHAHGVILRSLSPKMFCAIFPHASEQRSVSLVFEVDQVEVLSRVAEELGHSLGKITVLMSNGSSRIISSDSILVIGDFSDFDTLIAISNESKPQILYMDPCSAEVVWHQSPASYEMFDEWLRSARTSS